MTNLFIGLILALLATLSFSDPLGRHLVGSYEIVEGTYEELLGYTFAHDNHIYLNVQWILQRIREDGGVQNTYAVGACVLVHEAVHLRTAAQFPHGDEELPMLYQYVCLDRLGASVESKQNVYNAIQKMAVERYR
mgnify:FL=1